MLNILSWTQGIRGDLVIGHGVATSNRIMSMHKDVLLEIVRQNEFTSHFSFERVTEETAKLKLNGNTASIGFIYRHIGETLNLFGQLLGVPTDVQNTTIGQTDKGQHSDISYSRELIERGYRMLRDLVENSAEEDWLKPIETPFPIACVPLEKLDFIIIFLCWCGVKLTRQYPTCKFTKLPFCQ